MNINELINPDRIAYDAHAGSKKRALELISDLLTANNPNMTKDEIFGSLIERERLGSTGLGHGVAIPHARLKGREEAIGAFLKLDAGIDFDAIDQQPVDLVFALLVPEHYTDEHLHILANLAEIFGDDTFCEKLRNCNDVNQALNLLTHWQDQKTPA